MRIVQGHISRFVGIKLADPLQRGVGEPPRRGPHVQGVLALLHLVEVMDDHR